MKLAILMLALACPFCRDNVAGSAPMVQKGFRRAVPVLGVPAIGLFAGILMVGWKNRGEGRG
jgi:hypothetical protein